MRWTDSKGRSYFDRFWDKVDATGDCWVWTAATQRGYGMVKIDYGIRRAHLVAYRNLVGPLPNGKVIDHLCRNRACVNPDHMEPVSPTENVMRGYGQAATNARKTHCKRGHEFTPENTRQHPLGRTCRTCDSQKKPPPPHNESEGSVTFYRRGCRCDGCRTEATAARRALRRESVPVGGDS